MTDSNSNQAPEAAVETADTKPEGIKEPANTKPEETKEPANTKPEENKEPANTKSEENKEPPNTQPEDRLALLAKARSFLASPQVQYQDINAKRAFLVEKGLNDTEIADLIRTVVCVYNPLQFY